MQGYRFGFCLAALILMFAFLSYAESLSAQVRGRSVFDEINREGCLVFTKEIPDELIKRTGLSVGQGDEAIVLLGIGDKDVQIGMEPAKGIRRVGAEIEINKIHNLFHLYPGTYAFQFGRAKKVVSSQKRRVFRVGAGGNLNPLPSESIEVWQVKEMPPIQRISLTSRHAYLAGKDSSGKLKVVDAGTFTSEDLARWTKGKQPFTILEKNK